jgi:hypothetical protein
MINSDNNKALLGLLTPVFMTFCRQPAEYCVSLREMWHKIEK